MTQILYKAIDALEYNKAWVFLFFLLGYLGAYVFLGSGSSADPEQITALDPILLLVVQAIAAGIFFLLLPYLFVRFGVGCEEPFWSVPSWHQVGWLAIIVFSNLVVLSVIIEWNLNVDLPDGAFEEWAKSKELELKYVTEHIIDFQGMGHFLVGMLAIAILPALGEELLFRGLLQNLLRKTLRNPHVAIWVAALLFSAIHLQFYGFFPRMLIGALFGYLYLWSGKLSVAMLGHFFHNGLVLVLSYLMSMDTVDLEPDQLEQSAPIGLVLLFLLFGIIAVMKFRNVSQEE